MSKFINKIQDIYPSFYFTNIKYISYYFSLFYRKYHFKFEIIPLIIGGFVVIKSTVLATIKKRKVTAGIISRLST